MGPSSKHFIDDSDDVAHVPSEKRSGSQAGMQLALLNRKQLGSLIPEENMHVYQLKRDAFLISALAILTSSLWAQDDLAKPSQNKLAKLTQLPFQNNTTFGVGNEDAVVNVLNIQPVYPVTLGGINIINRAILPVVYQGERFAGEGSKFGLGDLSYTGFLSPGEPGDVIWGIGPSLLLPTATDDRLGTGKWSAGVGVVVLTLPGRWVIGVLAQNVWSVAGEDARGDVNRLLAQYFINYNLENGWYLSSAPIITANWKALSGSRWVVPVGGGVGKIFRLNGTPIDVQVQSFYNVEKPKGAGDWSTRLEFKLLFPKSGSGTR